jgi:hypothetical protein
MTADEFLQHTAAVVRSRRCSYGNPSDLFQRVATGWSQILGVKVSPVQVGLCLIDLKLARLVNDVAHGDSMIDIAGYAACVGEIRR